MEAKELRKVKREMNKINDQLNATASRVNKGFVTEFNDGSKWVEFNSFSFDGSHIIYNLDKYEEYLLDTTIDITSVPTLSLRDFHNMRREIGITKEYCVEPKKLVGS
jgi:hypothetical protein